MGRVPLPLTVIRTHSHNFLCLCCYTIAPQHYVSGESSAAAFKQVATWEVPLPRTSPIRSLSPCTTHLHTITTTKSISDAVLVHAVQQRRASQVVPVPVAHNRQPAEAAHNGWHEDVFEAGRYGATQASEPQLEEDVIMFGEDTLGISEPRPEPRFVSALTYFRWLENIQQYVPPSHLTSLVNAIARARPRPLDSGLSHNTHPSTMSTSGLRVFVSRSSSPQSYPAPRLKHTQVHPQNSQRYGMYLAIPWASAMMQSH